MDVDIKKAEEKVEYLSSDPKTLAHYKSRESSVSRAPISKAPISKAQFHNI